MSRRGPWRTLGIDPTEDRATIRRAYAAKLKALDVDREIEAYARLRGARDQALALATRLEPVGEEDERDEPWAGDVPGDMEQPSLLGDGEALDDIEAGGIAPGDPTPPEILLAILFPNGEQADQPLDQDEWERAARALAAVIGQAHEATVDQHGVIEEWLAHHLASAWPRSAYLLEEAAAAFKWLDEVGQLSERPAIAYLNTRLRGMRFYAKVQEPSHPLHKAWVELSKPGERSWVGSLRVSKSDVRHLIEGIRERYPEIEGHLDPVRVASWEATTEAEPASAWTTFIVLAVGASLLRVCAGMLDSSPPPLPPPRAAEANTWTSEHIDALVIDLFGERLNDDTLLAEAPEIWERIERAGNRPVHSPAYVGASGREILMALRGQIQLAARNADFATLIAIKELKLDLLRLIRDRGDAWDCLRYARQGAFPPHVEVPDELRARERELAARLAREDLLIPSDTQFAATASIPGSVIERIMQSTGLPEDAVRRAAVDRGDEGTLCNYRVALLEAVLQRPADVSADLLRMM